MKYDPILCMMVDDSVKMKDMKMTTRTTDKSYGKYKLPNGDIVEVIDRKNVHGIDSFVYKNKSGVHFARADWFMDNAVKVRDNKTIDKAIRSCDRVTVKYDDAIGDTHTFFKESEEEAKKWIDQGKFPHGAAFNVKIDGKLYKKEAR